MKDKKPKLKLFVRATDSADTLRFRVLAMTVTVNHAFGDNARYKGRNKELVLEIEPENLEFDVKAPDGEGFKGVDAADVLATILGPVVHGCEVVVAQAMEREKEVKDKALQEIGQQPAKPY